MIKKITLCAILLAPIIQIFSQTKTCETPNEEAALDLNSISKCSIKHTEGEGAAKKVTVEVTSRRRVVRKRNSVNAVNSSKSQKLASIKKNSSLVGALDLNKEEIMKNVPLELVEEIPLFKSCEKVPITQQKTCFKKQINFHLKKHFTYPKNAYDNNIQGRVIAEFSVDEGGNVAGINFRGPYKGELLVKEAKRIVKKLPKLKPAKHNGKVVSVKYGFPISFKIPGQKPSNIRRKSKVIEVKDVYSLDQADEIPLFTLCEKSGDNSVDCFNNELAKHARDYFNYPQQAVQNNIQGKVNIHFVIDKDGQVVNIKAKGPENGELLEKAAIELVEKLPNFKPATKGASPISVEYDFPINFKLN